MTHGRLQYLVVFVGMFGLPGCGYDVYMAKCSDTLVIQDYNNAKSAALGPVYASSQSGFSIQLPNESPAEPLPAENYPEGIVAIFDTPPDSTTQLRTVVAASHKPDSGDAPTLQDFVPMLLAAGQKEAWMGTGIVMDEKARLELKQRGIPAGPSLRRLKGKPERTVDVQFVTIDQKLPGVDTAGNERTFDFIWQLFFIDKGEDIGMFAYRMLKDDFAGELTKAVEFSITTADVFPPSKAQPDAAEAEGEPTKPSSKPPRKARRKR